MGRRWILKACGVLANETGLLHPGDDRVRNIQQSVGNTTSILSTYIRLKNNRSYYTSFHLG